MPMSGAELIGLWNRTPEKGATKAKQYGCTSYASVDELLSDPKVDAVFVLTNMETHCEYTIQSG